MVRQQEFAHSPLSLFDLFAGGGDDHSISAFDRARGLQLRHLVDANQAHTARSLQLEVFVITERRNAKALFAANIDQPSAIIDVEFLFVNCDFYLF